MFAEPPPYSFEKTKLHLDPDSAHLPSCDYTTDFTEPCSGQHSDKHLKQIYKLALGFSCSQPHDDPCENDIRIQGGVLLINTVKEKNSS